MKPKFCECGCGGITPKANKTDRLSGRVKGEHQRFVFGHGRRNKGDWKKCFWQKVDKTTSDCWLWLSTKQQDGYGYYAVNENGKRWGKCAHRIAYELVIGPIPDGLVLDHLCDNKSCVNPAHLEPVTQAVNLLRSKKTVNSINAAKTHCKHGHEFTSENTYIAPSVGTRHCKTCIKRRSKQYQNKRKKERQF